MYTSPTVIGVGVGAGGLAATGFGVAWYVVVASVLIVGGLLLLRLGHRRGAER